MNVLIYGEDGQRVDSYCEGPSVTGMCRRRTIGVPVACAGRAIRATDRLRTRSIELVVAPDARSCPLAALERGFDYGAIPWTPAPRAEASALEDDFGVAGPDPLHQALAFLGFLGYLTAVQALTWQPRLLLSALRAGRVAPGAAVDKSKPAS